MGLCHGLGARCQGPAAISPCGQCTDHMPLVLTVLTLGGMMMGTCRPRVLTVPAPPRFPVPQFYTQPENGNNQDVIAVGFLIALLYLAFKLYGELENLG